MSSERVDGLSAEVETMGELAESGDISDLKLRTYVWSELPSKIAVLEQALKASQQALENRTSENERLRVQNQKLNERLETMQSDADRDSQLIQELQAALEEGT